MLAGLLPLASLVLADTPVTNQVKPNQVCSEFNQRDTSIKWYPRLRLQQTYNGPDGILFEKSANLNKQNWQFDAGSLYDGKWDFIQLTGGNQRSGQFKFEFFNSQNQVLASMWATTGVYCRLPNKLNRIDVDHVSISMRDFS
jgi:hypothetical protein